MATFWRLRRAKSRNFIVAVPENLGDFCEVCSFRSVAASTCHLHAKKLGEFVPTCEKASMKFWEFFKANSRWSCSRCGVEMKDG